MRSSDSSSIVSGSRDTAVAALMALDELPLLMLATRLLLLFTPPAPPLPPPVMLIGLLLLQLEDIEEDVEEELLVDDGSEASAIASSGGGLPLAPPLELEAVFDSFSELEGFITEEELTPLTNALFVAVVITFVVVAEKEEDGFCCGGELGVEEEEEAVAEAWATVEAVLAEPFAMPATAELKAAGAISADVVKATAVVGVPELLLPAP